MRDPSPGTLRMILHAAARVLGCGSAQVALVDEARQALVIRLGVANRDVPLVTQVESLLGFSPEGAEIPLAAESNLLVRAVREGRLLVTARFAELVGANLLPDEVLAQVQSVIGTHTFAAVPVFGRGGPVGVILLEKPGESGFAPADRDLLVAYADRVGAALESEGVAAEVEALESAGAATPIGDVGSPPPTIYLCDAASGVIETGNAERTPLAQVLRASAAEAAIREAAGRPGEAARTIAIQTDDGRSLRVTLRPAGASLGVVAVVEDVGWLSRLSREAARTREHLARVLGSVSDAMFTLDAHGMIVGCNAAVQQTMGCATAELLGRPIGALLADSRVRSRAAALDRRLLRDGFAEAELSFSWRPPITEQSASQGRAFPASVSALLLADDDGRPAGALWRVRDLSERRRGEAERRRLRERLLRSERLSALGEMAARIAHEVRNPLVSIGAAARLVEEELGDGAGVGRAAQPLRDDVRETVREEARAISREVQRLDGILAGLLNLARPRAANRQFIDVVRTVEETVALVRARAPGVHLAVDAPGPCTARCDADGLRQILWNVLVNAVDASPDRGTVACEVRRRPAGVVISVTDEGPGLPAGVRRRAFDPFFSTKARGTGLGLAISKQIVDEHGGRIRLLGKKGGGTVVRIELPGPPGPESTSDVAGIPGFVPPA